MRRLNQATSRIISHVPSVPKRSSSAFSVSSPIEISAVISSAALHTNAASLHSRATALSRAVIEQLIDERRDGHEALRHVAEHAEIIEGRELLQALDDGRGKIAVLGKRHGDLAL